jgi:hypothetical protein
MPRGVYLRTSANTARYKGNQNGLGNKSQTGRVFTAEHRRKITLANRKPDSQWLDGHGYIQVPVYPEDPLYSMAWGSEHSGRRCAEHRLVMARKLGRPLQRGENVHHINGIKTDNRPDNLELWRVVQPSGVRVDDQHCACCRYNDGY